MAKTTTGRVAGTYQLIPVTDLSGGLDLRSSPTHMAPARARVLTNWSLSEPGNLIVRPGFLKFSTTSLGAQRLAGAQRVYLSSYTFTLLAYAGQLYRLSDGAGAASSVFSSVTSSNQVFFPHDRDLVAFFDGDNRPRKSSNGTLWRLMGITGPSTATGPTVSSTTAGGLSSAEFELSVTYKDRNQAFESNEGKVSTLTLTSTGTIELSLPNSSDVQVDALVVYARNKTAGETVRRKASSGATQSTSGSTTTNSTIRVTSSAWGSNDPAPTDHDIPPVLAFGVVWKNRWWGKSGTRGNRLHFTQLFQPQSWPAAFYVDIPFERGDSITAIVPHGDSLIVFGQSRAFVILGQTSLDFEVRPAAAQAGALGPRAAKALESGVVHAAAEGLYNFDGVTDQLLSHDLDVAWTDLITNGAPADVQLVSVAYHLRRKEVRVAVPRLYPTGAAGEFVLDLEQTRRRQQPVWTTTDRPIGGYIYWDGNETTVGNRGRLFSWSDTAGLVFEESTGTTANSSAMSASYEGPALSLAPYRARVVDFAGEYEANVGNLSVETLVDGVSQGTPAIAISGGLSLVGTAIVGTDRVSGGSRKRFHVNLPLPSEGRSIVAKATYTGKGAFRLFNYAYGVVPEGAPSGFSDG